MYNYIVGKITMQGSNYVVIENNNIGYEVRVGNPFSYEMDVETKIYLYNYVREEEYSLYGFKSLEEKELFLKLINVKGLGPKLIMPILATGSINGIIDAINRENILYLTKFPKIGEKLAKQIVLDLKNKINIEVEGTEENNNLEELISVLESLGYKSGEIKRVVVSVDQTKTLEEQVKEALKLLLK